MVARMTNWSILSVLLCITSDADESWLCTSGSEVVYTIEEFSSGSKLVLNLAYHRRLRFRDQVY
jgi:hypothetical protein